MKRSVMIVVAIGVLGVWCASKKKQAPTNDGRARTIVLPSDVHSQSPFYNGGSLDAYEYFDGATPDLAKLKPGDKATVQAHPNEHDAAVELTVMLLGPDELAGDLNKDISGKLQIYQVFDTRNGAYRDLCGGTTYDAPHGPNESKYGDALNRLQGKAFLVKGRWNHTNGKYVPPESAGGAVTFSCVSGIVGKCAHWGYIPGLTYPGPNGKESLTPYHQACVYAGRAEYLHGRSYTCDRTNFDVYDRLGIKNYFQGSGMTFEAAWTKEGLASLPGSSKPYLRQARYSECDQSSAPELILCGPNDPCDDPQNAWTDGTWVPEVLISESTNPAQHHTTSGKCPSAPGACGP